MFNIFHGNVAVLCLLLYVTMEYSTPNSSVSLSVTAKSDSAACIIYISKEGTIGFFMVFSRFCPVP